MARIADKHGLTNKYRPLGQGKRVVKRGRPRKYLLGPPPRRRSRMTKKENVLSLQNSKDALWCFVAILVLIVFMILVSRFSSTGSTSTKSNQPVAPIEFSLNQYSKNEVEIEVGKYGRVTFDVLPFDTTEDGVEIINSNESVVECDLWTVSSEGVKKVVINLKGKAEGSATISLKDKNSASQSVSINITVVKLEEEVDNSHIEH